jgi:hypothetical protein
MVCRHPLGSVCLSFFAGGRSLFQRLTLAVSSAMKYQSQLPQRLPLYLSDCMALKMLNVLNAAFAGSSFNRKVVAPDAPGAPKLSSLHSIRFP